MDVFYSFHYGNDYWRVQQIRNIGILDNSNAVAAQDWETVPYKSDVAIRNWIDSQMYYKQAVIVLIGSATWSRHWVQYEIQRALTLKKLLLGIRIHGLKDQNGETSSFGRNPFYELDEEDWWKIPVFDPKGIDSKQVYADISTNLSSWIAQGYRRP